MAATTRCPRCGRENDPSFSFCLDCGQSLRIVLERPCPRCGARMPLAFRFCGHCGQAVVEGAPPQGGLTPAPGRLPLPASGPGPGPAAAPGTPATPATAAPPEPAPGTPRLVLVRHDGAPGPSHPLARETTVCGRREGDVLLPEDGSVSPRHASVTLRGGRLWLEDLGSTAGTFLRLRAARALVFGDEIRLGRQLLRLEPLPRPNPAAGDARPWGSPDPGYRARLVQVLEGGGTGEAFPLRPGSTILGREGGDVAFPGDRYVSARHARVDVIGAAVSVSDLGSSNGTFVRVTGPVEISAGDQFLVGMQLLRVEA